MKSAAQQQASAAARYDDRDVAADPPQRGQVEVVAVQMAQEHRVDGAQGLRRRRRRVPPQVGDAVAQQGVGEQSHAVEIDERGAVPDPRHVRHPRRVCSFAPGTAG